MKHALFIEPTVDCDFGLYYLIGGEPCENRGTVALVNTRDKSDPDYPEGFHEAHLCDEHGIRVLREVDSRDVNRPPWVQPPTTIPEGI